MGGSVRTHEYLLAPSEGGIGKNWPDAPDAQRAVDPAQRDTQRHSAIERPGLVERPIPLRINGKRKTLIRERAVFHPSDKELHAVGRNRRDQGM